MLRFSARSITSEYSKLDNIITESYCYERQACLLESSALDIVQC